VPLSPHAVCSGERAFALLFLFAWCISTAAVLSSSVVRPGTPSGQFLAWKNHLLHHLLRLLERGEQLIDVLGGGAATGRDAPFAAAVDHLGVVALAWRHREDDGFRHLQLIAFQRLFDRRVFEHAPHAGDSPEVAEWRQRMGTEQAKEIYKERAATAECVNAQARNRGLTRLLVRGLQKVKAVALWFATVHNMARGFALLPQVAASPG